MKDTRARTLEVNDRTYEAWNAHDPDAVAAVFAEDALVREVGRPEVARGRRLDADGMVAEDVHLSDTVGLLAQLGLA